MCCVSANTYNTYMTCKSISQFLFKDQWSHKGYFWAYTSTRHYNKFEKVCNFVKNRNDLNFFAELFFKKMKLSGKEAKIKISHNISAY